MGLYMKKFFLYFSIMIFIIFLLIDLSPFLKFKIFQITHPNWIQIKTFRILKSDTVCSRIGPGVDNLSKTNIIYEYFYNKKSKISQQNDVIVIYKLYIFEGCQDLKNQNLKIWNEYFQNNKVELWVDKNNQNHSKILISDKNINLKMSKISFYLSEVQGFLVAIIFMFSSLLIYLFIKKR